MKKDRGQFGDNFQLSPLKILFQSGFSVLGHFVGTATGAGHIAGDRKDNCPLGHCLLFRCMR